MLSWLVHRCSAGRDAVCVDVIMVCTWMLCTWERMESEWTLSWSERMVSLWLLSWLGHGCAVGNGWSLSERYDGWDMNEGSVRRGLHYGSIFAKL